MVDSVTEDTKEQIEEILRCDREENPFEELFWDQHNVHMWVQVMTNLKAALELAEVEIATIARRQM